MDKYDASSIEIIENLEAVRKRPGMYIGDTNTRGLHHLAKELIDNSVDEFLMGFANEINVILKPDNFIVVEDNGRGIPIDIHPKSKKTAVETIFTTLHAGGKFGGENSGYKISGGLHGVGSSVVNALSDVLKITVWRKNKEYKMEFYKGGKIKRKLYEVGPTDKQGTKIEFKPSNNIFESIDFKGSTIANILKIISYLNIGLKINFSDQKNEIDYTFSSTNGLIDYINELTENNNIITNAYGFSEEKNDISIKLAFKFTTSSHENVHSFVNNIPTSAGGSHENGFKNALNRAFNEFLFINKNLQQTKNSLEGTDIREGMYAILSIYLPENYLQFEGQTKSKLASKEAEKFVEETVYHQVKLYLNKNREIAEKLIKKIYLANKAREAAKRAREVTKELNKSKSKSFVGKLVTAQAKKSIDRELFVVEGDSAGGSAKLGRDRKTQAILPLKGKIINSEKATLKAILANDELATLIHAIGGDLGEEFDKTKINYGKIIIMTDADTDGAHIQALILTFLYRFMKPLVDEGMVYIAMPPLFKLTNKKSKKINYAWSDEEMRTFKDENSNYEIQRYKGLGEMNSDQLWETTMDPTTRTLIKVSSEDAEEADKIIQILMGQDASIRREWIEENVIFSLEDTFSNLKKTSEKNE